MRICFYFVLFITAKSLNFCCEECCGDCCCDWWYNLWEDCYKKSNKEEEEKEEEEEKKDDHLDDYKEKAKQKYLQNREKIGEQKEELKNKIRQYLSHIEKQVGNINNNFGIDNSVKKELLNQITRINELIGNFQKDEYFNRNSIEIIRKDWEDLQGFCSKAGIIKFDDFYKRNEEWKKFLEDNSIQERYEEAKNITEDIFSLDNTLEKLKNNFGTYLLEIFKTRLFPEDENKDKYKYKNEFMNFYTEYNIGSLKDIWDGDYLQDFYKKIFQKVKYNKLEDTYEKQAFEIYKKELLQEQHRYLGYALLTDGNEDKIIEKIYEQIECNIFGDERRLKDNIIPPLIGSFKNNIVEIIKDSFQEQLNVNKNLQKNNSENIKNTASRKYNEAIKNLNGEKIELTFYNSYGISMETTSFLKDCKLSVLFDYVLSKGRDFYAKDDNDNVDKKTPYLTYEKEKKRIELKTAANWGDSLKEAIDINKDITIGKFYEKQPHNVYMFF